MIQCIINFIPGRAISNCSSVAAVKLREVKCHWLNESIDQLMMTVFVLQPLALLNIYILQKSRKVLECIVWMDVVVVVEGQFCVFYWAFLQKQFECPTFITGAVVAVVELLYASVPNVCRGTTTFCSSEAKQCHVSAGDNILTWQHNETKVPKYLWIC